MPKYQCHKQVWALKIKSVVDDSPADAESDGSRVLSFDNPAYAERRVDHAYVSKHKPVAGGYFVVYDDGYQSFSPADVFEAGYTLI